MIYKKRNLDNIAKLADNTKAAATAWHEYLEKEGIEILIYETIRSEATQRENVKKGASQTMKSYHLVGQALDFVPVNAKGDTLWGGYNTADVKAAVKKAKALGFEWGGDWSSFVDKPHLEYHHKGYGTDTFGKVVAPVKAVKPVSSPSSSITSKYPTIRRGSQGTAVVTLQTKLLSFGYTIGKADGIFGEKVENAVQALQRSNNLEDDGVVGPKTWEAINATKPAKAAAPKYKTGKATGDVWVHNKADFKASTQVYVLEKNKSVRIYGEKNGMYNIGTNAYVSKKYIK